jgi:hypothetical protein
MGITAKDFEGLMVRKADRLRTKADKLAKLISKEKGVTVRRHTAIGIAINEALERRERKRHA